MGTDSRSLVLRTLISNVPSARIERDHLFAAKELTRINRRNPLARQT